MKTEKVKALLRPAVFSMRLLQAYLKSRSPLPMTNRLPLGGFAFVVGCGRSGTTILGKILSSHPQIRYFFEPWHLWRAVDRRTDALQLFGAVEAHMLMTENMSNSGIKIRFERLFFGGGKFLNIEKTPHNVMRIPYLETLCPDAKYIHILRDGYDVATSIEKLAITNKYKLIGREDYNQWWGISDSKWKALKADGIKAGYYTDEVASIADNFGKAAYEWLVSIGEAEKNKQRLGDRLLEIRYQDLVGNTEHTLSEIANFLNVSTDDDWLITSKESINSVERYSETERALPEKMARDFNRFQEKYGFSRRVRPLENSVK